MPTQQDIKDILYDAVDTIVTSKEIIWYNQPEKGVNTKAPQPTGTYIVLSFLGGFRREGAYDERRDPITGSSDFTKAIITGQRLLTVNIEAFGVGSFDIITDIQNAFQEEDTREALKRRQVTTIEVSSLLPPPLNYIIYLDGILVTYTVQMGDTIKDVRDGLALAAGLKIDVTGITPSAGITDADLVLTGRVGKEFDYNLGTGLTFTSTINAVDLAFIGDEGSVDLSELEDTSWESRFSMDIQLRSHTAIFKTAEIIEDAEINVNISGNEFTIDIDT